MKKCPVCQKARLSQVLLENELPAYECSECGGLWISSQEYLSWNRSQPTSLSQEVKVEGDLPFPVMDNRMAILCPDCGRILRRFKIWPDIEFHLDRCGSCNGVWFDKNEWQALSYHNLQYQVNLFFTDLWQKKLKNEEMRRRFEKMYLEKFGNEDYQKLKEIRRWLEKHPYGGSLLAYLTDRDPYKG